MNSSKEKEVVVLLKYNVKKKKLKRRREPQSYRLGTEGRYERWWETHNRTRATAWLIWCIVRAVEFFLYGNKKKKEKWGGVFNEYGRLLLQTKEGKKSRELYEREINFICREMHPYIYNSGSPFWDPRTRKRHNYVTHSELDFAYATWATGVSITCNRNS